MKRTAQRIKQAQGVEKIMRVNPAIKPEFFDDRRFDKRQKLAKELYKLGWRLIQFKDTKSGMLNISGVRNGHEVTDSSTQPASSRQVTA